MKDETYNGYCNRETWAVALWLQNDEGFYRDTLDMSARDLEDYVKSLEEFKHEPGLRKMFDDIGSLWRVDWKEVEEACKSE